MQGAGEGILLVGCPPGTGAQPRPQRCRGRLQPETTCIVCLVTLHTHLHGHFHGHLHGDVHEHVHSDSHSCLTAYTAMYKPLLHGLCTVTCTALYTNLARYMTIQTGQSMLMAMYMDTYIVGLHGQLMANDKIVHEPI